jgi:hypothetical protein
MSAEGRDADARKGLKATSLAKAARRVSVPPATIFAALVYALLGGPPTVAHAIS